MSSTAEPLKILMLHGYTQNGTLFHAKTRALEKHLQKIFPGTVFCYPTGPLRLNPKDVPGFDPDEGTASDDLETYGWWRRSNNADPPKYEGLEDGLRVVAESIRSEGPFDGVMGFSQGAALAAMVASLLEGPTRREAFKHAQSQSSLAIPYPASFESLQQASLKFCVLYAGFVAPGERYTAFYNNPVVQTPSCHVIGSLDSLVEESRTQALLEACGGESKVRVVVHPGGHFVPSGKPYLDAVADFVRVCTSPSPSGRTEKEEKAEDMDMPF